MQLTDRFSEVWPRLLARDADAARWIVEQVKPRIRPHAARLTRSMRLPPFYTAEDTCQWVLGQFLSRVCRKQLRFPNLRSVVKCVYIMVRNRVVDLARHHRDECSLQGMPTASIALDEVPDPAANPAEIVDRREAVEQVRQELSEEEWRILWSRVQGQSWRQIADEGGSTSDAVRMRYARLVERVKNATRENHTSRS